MGRAEKWSFSHNCDKPYNRYLHCELGHRRGSSKAGLLREGLSKKWPVLKNKQDEFGKVTCVKFASATFLEHFALGTLFSLISFLPQQLVLSSFLCWCLPISTASCCPGQECNPSGTPSTIHFSVVDPVWWYAVTIIPWSPDSISIS